MTELEELIQAFRKETEDLVKKNVETMFNIKSVESSLSAGNNSISLTGEAYDDTDYVINIYSAMDANSIDVRGELEVSGKTVSGFVINSVNPCTVKLTTMRKLPKAQYETDG